MILNVKCLSYPTSKYVLCPYYLDNVHFIHVSDLRRNIYTVKIDKKLNEIFVILI